MKSFPGKRHKKRPGSLNRQALYRISYLSLQMILPLERSYGESSIVTLSPGRIRMKFIRSLPLIWASTTCLFSSYTLNIALGSFSRTVPSTSITSAFDIFYLLCHDNNCCLQIRKRQNLWFPIGDEDRIFIMCGK